MLFRSIQNAELVIDDDKTILDYITEYQSRAKSDQFCNFARNLGINETALKKFMSLHVTEEDINAFGRYDKLVEQVNIDVAKEYFEKAEKTEIPKRKVRSKLDKLLREFILSGGFEISTNE